MIRLPAAIDLGRDTTRMSKREDALRQKRTVDQLLRRFFSSNPQVRREVQVLADEVGMGKTYVALSVACAILNAMQTGDAPEDLVGCYQRVLILAPSSALIEKWTNEVGEFIRRCAAPGSRDEFRWFTPQVIERIDELPGELGRPGAAPRLIIAPLDFAGAKLKHYELKRRMMLAALFRHWGVAFAKEKRDRLLRGAPDGWPKRCDRLAEPDDWERHFSFIPAETLYPALQELSSGRCSTSADAQELISDLLARCQEGAEPYTRDRGELFEKISKRLVDLYRLTLDRMIRKALPLVIVDEAHNWKNGPTSGSNGWEEFSRLIATRTRRLLMLSATPFQLRPEEMLHVLQTGDHLEPCPPSSDPTTRVKRLALLREQTLKPVLSDSESESRKFAKMWRRLPPGTSSASLHAIWTENADLRDARERLARLADEPGRLEHAEVERALEGTLKSVDPKLRPFFTSALRLFARNRDLSAELGTFVIRHRRGTEHRLFRVGEEFVDPDGAALRRPDRKVLHAAAGMDVRGDAELPHYLLMRCVSGMKKTQGKSGVSSLGSNLTGCYSTLFKSAEGNLLNRMGANGTETTEYFALLQSLVNEKSDPRHPKVMPVVDQVVEDWSRGEKSLIFCFRVNTAERLRDIISERVEQEMSRREREVLGDPNHLKNLRKRMSGREQDLSPLTFDRVLISRWIAEGRQPPLTEQDFSLDPADAGFLARMALDRGVNLLEERPDRVFIHRATENLLARRWLKRRDLPRAWGEMLEQMADDQWVEEPYGLERQLGDRQDDEAGATLQIDERGIHGRYPETHDATEAKVENVSGQLRRMISQARSGSGRQFLLSQYARTPNLWLGADPLLPADGGHALVQKIHGELWKLTEDEGGFDWGSRLLVMRALRRAALRRSILILLLKGEDGRAEGTWGELLARRFHEPLPDQSESMAHRMAIFLEDLASSSGSLSREQGARHAMLEATRLTDKPVALVGGSGGKKTTERNRIFSGFNSPLYPDILICTSVGAEGIDLHRHCRRVIHYDLAWNPAVLEQRTGRVDRIGSKTFRERATPRPDGGPFLQVDVPFLAGTYDERMFEELRLRAQTFEVLTGGEFAADHAEGDDHDPEAQGEEKKLALVPLPPEMIKDLRVDLQVYEGEE